MRVRAHYCSPLPSERTRAIARHLAGILYVIQSNFGRIPRKNDLARLNDNIQKLIDTGVVEGSDGVDSRLYRTKKPAMVAGFYERR